MKNAGLSVNCDTTRMYIVVSYGAASENNKIFKYQNHIYTLFSYFGFHYTQI